MFTPVFRMTDFAVLKGSTNSIASVLGVRTCSPSLKVTTTISVTTSGGPSFTPDSRVGTVSFAFVTPPPSLPSPFVALPSPGATRSILSTASPAFPSVPVFSVAFSSSLSSVESVALTPSLSIVCSVDSGGPSTFNSTSSGSSEVVPFAFSASISPASPSDALPDMLPPAIELCSLDRTLFHVNGSQKQSFNQKEVCTVCDKR